MPSPFFDLLRFVWNTKETVFQSFFFSIRSLSRSLSCLFAMELGDGQSFPEV